MFEKNRILLKVSGEALMGKMNFGLDVKIVSYIANEIKEVYKNNYQICLIIGGGNIFRGIEGASEGIDRSTSDYMGMLATVINALSMQSALEQIDVPTRVQSAISMSQIAEPYIRRKAIRHLEKNRIVIFAAGTGNPFFSTDTAASLRASEMNCSMIVKGTKVDGIYDKDPINNDDAKFFKDISYIDVLKNNLKVILCVGETFIEKKQKKTKQIISSQIIKGLKKIKDTKNIIIAYEPVWSIGTGKLLSTDELSYLIEYIKKILKSRYKIKKTKVLYGGSVKTKNIDQLKKIDILDGFLIGGASRNPQNLIDIVKKSYI